jgi:hypothetical protein
VAGQHDQAALIVQEKLQGVLKILQFNIPAPRIEANQPRREEHFNEEDEELAHTAPCHFAADFFGHLGKTAAQIPHGPFTVLSIHRVHNVPQQGGGGEIRPDWEAMEDHRHQAKADVLKTVKRIVAGLFFAHGWVARSSYPPMRLIC